MKSALLSYLSLPLVACYEGEGGDPPPATPPVTPPSTPPAGFTQEQVNKFLAEEKRKNQAQYQKLEQQLQSTLETAKLTAEERTKMEESLEDVRKQLRTKEESAKLEKKALEERLTGEVQTWKSKAEANERKYIDSTISRALLDAAVAGDAFNPETVVTVLRGSVKMVEDKPMVDFPDVSSETGEPIIKQMTPEEAIKRMKQIPDKYGNLFKSGVVGGLGAASATGGTPGTNGRVDVRNLTPEQYQKIRKENPAALGLRPLKK